MARRFEIDNTITRQCRRYNAAYSAILTPSDNRDPVGHFLASVNELFEYVFQDVNDSDKVGITVQN